MSTVNIVINCNNEHLAATYALFMSIVENKHKESIYQIWIKIDDNAVSKDIFNRIQSDKVHIEYFTDYKMIDKSVKRVICLQWNTLVQSDLSDLYEFDMKGKTQAKALNIPNAISYIPQSVEKYDDAVSLIDFTAATEEQTVAELPIYFNFAYDQMIQNSDMYDSELLKNLNYVNESDIERIKKKSIIFRYSQEYSPELYFDHPYSEQWTHYLILSGYDMTELECTKAYQETVGIMHKQKKDIDIIPISFYISDNEAVYAVALINSINANLKKNKKLDIRILQHLVSEKHKKMLLQMNSDNVSVTLYNINTSSREEAFLHVPQLFNDQQKVIWLNCKMICTDDISELFGHDISDIYFEATVGKINKKRADEDAIADEVNLKNTVYPDMSVVLINIKKWLLDNMTYKVKYLLNKKINLQKSVYIACKNHIGELSHKWNYIEDGMEDQVYLSRFKMLNYENSRSPWTSMNENFCIDAWKYLQMHLDYENLKDEIIEIESGKGNEVKEIIAKIENLENENKKLTEEKNVLKQQNKILQQQNDQINQEKGQFLYELVETRKSFTYKVGRFITFIPRHLRSRK